MSSSTLLNFSSKEFETEKAVEPNGEIETIPVRIETSISIYETTVILEDVRRKNLRRNRMWFGIVSVICFCALVASFILHIPYEPAAAILCCVFGTFLVFVIKLRDAKPR